MSMVPLTKVLCFFSQCFLLGYAWDDTCAVTQFPPGVANWLNFCRWYNGGETCCLPGYDNDIAGYWEGFIGGLGPGCTNALMYPEAREWFCATCDPNQPNFSDSDDGKMYVCQSFADRFWASHTPGAEPDGTMYNNCGVMRDNPCLDIMADFDPFMCGDDVWIPTNEFENAAEFLNSFHAVGLEDFEVHVVPDDFRGGGHCFMGGGTLSPASSLGTSTVVLTASIVLGLVMALF